MCFCGGEMGINHLRIMTSLKTDSGATNVLDGGEGDVCLAYNGPQFVFTCLPKLSFASSIDVFTQLFEKIASKDLFRVSKHHYGRRRR